MPAGVTVVGTDENLSGCTLLVEAVDGTSDYLSIKVTNPTGTETWRWMAHVDGVEAVYGI
jgi:formylmethanofuran dehydrogenase subunit A